MDMKLEDINNSEIKIETAKDYSNCFNAYC